MKVKVEQWRKEKEFFWKRILEDLEIGYMDRDLIPLLITINMDVELHTTSSCSGRLVVLDSENPWKRDETGTVFKSHTPIQPEELEFVYELQPYTSFWLVATGPIIHLSSLKTKRAIELLSLARRVGFKHSGVMYYSSKKGVFVELVTGIFLVQLVKRGSRTIVPRSEIETLVEVFNGALIEGKKRLQRLYEEFSKVLPKQLDEYIEKEARIFLRSFIGRTPIDVFLELCREKGAPCKL